MHLFLEGPRGIGKSTLLRETLLPYQDRLAGFAVQRLFENGALIGFRAILLDGFLPALEAEYAPSMDNVFILRGRKDPSVLDKIILQVEEERRNSQWQAILLDEIGGIELYFPVFMNALSNILSGEKPCIGVLKSAENLAHMAEKLHLEQSCLELREKLEHRIKSNGTILRFDRTDTSRDVSMWAKKHLE